ncbi:MAG: hypothetical protein ACI9YR_002419, partial [Bacteroidia bacterium]
APAITKFTSNLQGLKTRNDVHHNQTLLAC